MNQDELNDLDTLLAEAGVTGLTDLLDKMNPDALHAIRSALIANQPMTEEEQAYFDAHHDYDCALQNASQASYTALNTQTAADLSEAGWRFTLASEAAEKMDAAKRAMDAAFALTPAYAKQQAAKAGKGETE